MSSIVLYLIRHGKTYCNENKLYCGSSDISLSESGKEELKSKKDKVNYPICNLNFTSGAKRANETFRIIYPDLKFKELRDFWEYNFGDFELKSYEDLKEDKRYIDWILDKSLNVCCPNGESKSMFRSRIKLALENLLNDIEKLGEEEAVLVCHGGTIGTLLEVFHNSDKDFYSYQPDCGGGYKLKVNYDKQIKIDILGEF